MCVLRVLHYIHQFFLSLRLLVARTGRSLMDAQPCCTTTILTHARALSFPSFTAFLPPPFPLMNNFSFHLISLSSNCHDQSITLIPHLIPHTLYIYSHSRRRSPQCHRLCCFHIFLSLLPCHSTGASFKPLGTTICPLCSTSLLRCPHHNPTRFFRKFHTHIQFPHFSPTPRLYHQLKRRPLSHRSRA